MVIGHFAMFMGFGMTTESTFHCLNPLVAIALLYQTHTNSTHYQKFQFIRFFAVILTLSLPLPPDDNKLTLSSVNSRTSLAFLLLSFVRGYVSP
jgi:hypothetical protein